MLGPLENVLIGRTKIAGVDSNGGTRVVVRGDNFAPGAVCTFGDLPPTSATFYAVDHLACMSPSTEARQDPLGSQLLTVTDSSGERRGEC